MGETSARVVHWLKRWFGALDQELLAALLLLLLSGWLFGALADQVSEPWAAHAEESLLLALRDPTDLADPIGSAYVEDSVRDITALGSSIVAILIAAAVFFYLLLVGRPRLALLLTVAIGGGAGLAEYLKEVFNRPRPTVVPHLVEVSSRSFPSGHSTTAALVYLTLAVLLARTTKNRLVQAYVMLVAIAVVIAVGFSRVYLGVHYPRDVLAGWALGVGWATLCGLGARFLQRKHRLEPPHEA